MSFAIVQPPKTTQMFYEFGSLRAPLTLMRTRWVSETLTLLLVMVT